MRLAFKRAAGTYTYVGEELSMAEQIEAYKRADACLKSGYKNCN